MTTSEIRIRYGAVAPPIKEQLAACGFKANLPSDVRWMQRAADDIRWLYMLGVLTDAEKMRALRRLHAAITANVRPLQ